MTANSVQLEQDHDWRPRHARLWGVHASKPAMRLVLPPPPAEPEPEPIPPGAPPIDFKATGFKFIVAYVAAKHGLSMAGIIGTSRKPALVVARREAMFLVRTHTTRSLSEIAKFFGGRHHSSVFMSIRNHRRIETP